MLHNFLITKHIQNKEYLITVNTFLHYDQFISNLVDDNFFLI